MRNGFKAALAVSAMTVLGGVAAHAVPAFTNPNFQSTVTTSTYAYSVPITGWTDASGSGSATGIAAAYSAGLWDNGKQPSGLTNVVFLQNEGSALQQTVSGFVIGHSYQINVDVNERRATSGQSNGSGGNFPGGPVGLSIGVNGLGVDGEPITAVDPYAVYATPWINTSTFAFTATSTQELVQFMNFGIPGSSKFDDVTLLLANATISDLSAVPEPASLALLLIGVGGVVTFRRRVSARQS